MGTRSFVSLPSLNLGYASTVIAASPSDLSSIPTLGPLTEGGYQNGQQAFVSSNGYLYTLQPATGGTVDGLLVLATADDPTKNWIVSQRSLFGNATGVPVMFATANLDFTTPQTVDLIPALGAGIYYAQLNGRFAFISQTGTCSTGPTVHAGNNASLDNVIQSGANLPSATNLNNTVNGPPGINLAFSAPLGAVSLATKIQAVIATGASGTGGYTLRGRVVVFGWLFSADLFT